MSYPGIQSLITYNQTDDPYPGITPQPGDIWYDPDDGPNGTLRCWCSVVNHTPPDPKNPGWRPLVTFTV